MALTCPHVIWRVAPFNTSNNCFTESFEFFRCDWRWEYSVHSKDDNEMPEEIISIHLRRLTNSPACSLTRFSTIASVRDSDGEHHAVRITNHQISPEVSWCVWKKSKYYILGHDVVENNGCAFSLTLEPLDHLEFMDCALNEENESKKLKTFSFFFRRKAVIII